MTLCLCNNFVIMLFIIYSALRHPNIVLFMGYTCEGDNIQIITNFVDGSDLHRVLFTEVHVATDFSLRNT